MMRRVFLFYLLFSITTISLQSQQYIIYQPDMEVNYILVDSEGTEQFRTPPDWYIIANGSKAFEVKHWPVLFRKRIYGQDAQYAQLAEDGTWTVSKERIANTTPKAEMEPPIYTIETSSPGVVQVLDANKLVVWADSCDRVNLIGEHMAFVMFKYHNLIPAYQLIDLRKPDTPVWQNKDFTISEWHQLNNVDQTSIHRVHLGLGTRVYYPESRKGNVSALPANFLTVINEMPELEALLLEAKDAQGLLGELTELQHLQELSLKQCALTTIPPTIRQMTSLEELDLSENNLSTLPKAIFRMQQLKVLNIKGNDFPPKFIPRLMKALPSTEIIYKRR